MPDYFIDSSGVVKRYVSESGSPWILELTRPDSGNDLFVARVTGAEVVSAFARLLRHRALTIDDAAHALTSFRFDFAQQYEIIEITEEVVDRAMSLAEKYALRGYDAIQLAAAVELHSIRDSMGLPPIVIVSADAELNEAALAEGLTLDNPNMH